MLSNSLQYILRWLSVILYGKYPQKGANSGVQVRSRYSDKNVLEVVHVLWNHNELMQKLTRRLLKLNPINTEWKPGLAINSMR